ncbi:hypothetical protein F2P56_023315 [Juglans regia]|uniref:Hyoscyamine 6-dioxygenase-like n=2 Tax=Juglans regia TaxID=51240 RepID=A0A2I4F0Q4_JUGRE|nr:hyoscyamine 6-dioxygenase-like [Juglans regia]KAF5459362.1 hypothetical protein F2P56_023315 [Juglans regia]
MEKLISSRSNLQLVPESYVIPPESRPGNAKVPLFETIPVIDIAGELGSDRAQLVKQIMQACQDFGFFQLINHGVSKKLMHDVLEVVNELFELPAKDKESICSEDPKQSCRLYASIDYDREKVHYWRETLRHPCHPLEEHVQFWPEKPARYRKVVGSYSAEVMKLSLWLLDLICEGLGFEAGYFEDHELTQNQLMYINHYPPCPDPSLTLGLPKHSDPNLLTLLLQEKVSGLQILKDGEWLGVEPNPNAFVVNVGLTLQIISNGKLLGAEHRAVTQKNVARTSIATFIYPSENCHIGPEKSLLSECSSTTPPLYRGFAYKDYLSSYVADTNESVPPLERYKIQY